ncbi:hypothetical protein D3C73_1099990 [compost metagenome]
MRLEEGRVRRPRARDVRLAQGGQFGGLGPGPSPDQGRPFLTQIQTEGRQFGEQAEPVIDRQAVHPCDQGLAGRLPGATSLVQTLAHRPVQGLDHPASGRAEGRGGHGEGGVGPRYRGADRQDGEEARRQGGQGDIGRVG